MKTKNKECKGGFSIEVSPFNKTILSATSSGGHKISLNDIVCSSGRVFCPKGTLGRVIEIDEPFDGNTTDHIFLVDFGSYGSYHMGFQDLMFVNGTYVVPATPIELNFNVVASQMN